MNIVNVDIFYAKFLLDSFDFSSDFYVQDFVVLCDLNFSSLIHKCQQLNSSCGSSLLKVK